MELAAKVLAVAAPELEPPDSVRQQARSAEAHRVDLGRSRGPGGPGGGRGTQRRRPRERGGHRPADPGRRGCSGIGPGRYRVRPGCPQRTGGPGHARAREPGQGPGARRCRGGGARGHRRRGGAGACGPCTWRSRGPPSASRSSTHAPCPSLSAEPVAPRPLRRRGSGGRAQRPGGRRLPGPGGPVGVRARTGGPPRRRRGQRAGVPGGRRPAVSLLVPREPAARSHRGRSRAPAEPRIASGCIFHAGAASRPRRPGPARRAPRRPGDGRVVPHAHGIRPRVRGLVRLLRRRRPLGRGRGAHAARAAAIGGRAAWPRGGCPLGQADRPPLGGHARADLR